MAVDVKKWGMDYYEIYSQTYDKVEAINGKHNCPYPNRIHFVDSESQRPTGILQEVRCRKCVNCMRMRQAQWMYRGAVEYITSQRTWFITLTWGGNEPRQYEDVKKYFKRLRKAHGTFRYLCTEELGDENKRIHWHILLHCSDNMSWRAVTSKWPHGHVHCKMARTSGLASYIAKYAAKGGRIRASRFYGEEPGQRHNDRWPTEDFEHYYRTGEKSIRLANLQFSHGKYGIKFPDLQRLAEMFTGDDRELLSCDTIPF
jgi:hypothetical protein